MGNDHEQQPPVPLQRERDRAVQLLIDHYAAENLTIAEFETRLDSVYAADTVAHLEGALSGLPAMSAPESDPRDLSARKLSGDSVRERGRQVTLLGYYEKKGSWSVPRKMKSFAIMSATSLDFREARMAPGVTELKVRPIMGYVEVVVPPGLAVETHGFGVLGGFEGLDQEGTDPDPEAPRLVIGGCAIMGYVEVTVRLPGESAEDARRRQRALRRHEWRARLGAGPDS